MPSERFEADFEAHRLSSASFARHASRTSSVERVGPTRRRPPSITGSHMPGFAGAAWIPQRADVPYVVGVSITFTFAYLCYVPASRALAAKLAAPGSRGRQLAEFEFSYGVAAAIAPAFGLTYDIAAVVPWLSMSVLLIRATGLLGPAETTIPVSNNRLRSVEGKA